MGLENMCKKTNKDEKQPVSNKDMKGIKKMRDEDRSIRTRLRFDEQKRQILLYITH